MPALESHLSLNMYGQSLLQFILPSYPKSYCNSIIKCLSSSEILKLRLSQSLLFHIWSYCKLLISISENTYLDHLQAAGYNEVDTARIYIGGKQEAFTRDAKWKERGLTLATKVYPDTPGKHAPENLTEDFNTSLKELGTDCVDIFYLHAAVCAEECRHLS